MVTDDSVVVVKVDVDFEAVDTFNLVMAIHRMLVNR